MESSSVIPSAIYRPLKSGVYCPAPTFFLPDSEDLDIPTFESHVVAVASAGIGLVLCGSMGEAHHLEPEERIQLIKTARAALDRAGLIDTPIIAGTGVGSTRESIKLTKQAAEAGADYAIVILSGYFAGSLIPDRAAIKAFFRELATQSPIPVMIYNFPGASGGIDLDSDIIEELSAENPNICGVKLTCGNVGKLTRIASTVTTTSFVKQHPRKNPESHCVVLGGFADFILPSLYVNAHGAITGLSNIAPYTAARLYQLSAASFGNPSVLAEAQVLQGVVAKADRTIALHGIAGTKWLMQETRGYGGLCRKPLGPMKEVEAVKLLAHPHVVELLQLEKVYEGEAKAKAKTA